MTDKELMWKKLSTVKKPSPLAWLEQRNNYGWKKGQKIVIMSSGSGKTMYVDIETNK